MKMVTCGLATALLMTAATGASAATKIVDVQFAGSFSFFCPNGGNACSNAQQSGAAVIGSAGDQWNYFTSGSGNRALADTTGASSGISISFSSDEPFSPYYDGTNYNNFYGTAYQNLMAGYLASTNANGIVVTFSGLAANQAFDLYAYSAADSTSSFNRQMNVTVNGTTKLDTQTGAGTFTEGANYLHYSGTADANGKTNLSASSVLGEADLNGIQLSVAAVPEPASWAMMILGMGAVGGALRRRQKTTTRVAFAV